MHWIIQDNLHHDQSIEKLLETLARAGIPHTLHKVIPFVGEIEPDISPEGHVMVVGSYSLRHVARRKGWVPGCFDLGDLSYADHVAHWGDHMLNADAVYCPFQAAPEHMAEGEYFLRPVVDSKFFAGTVMARSEFTTWWEKVVVLEEDTGNSLRGSTEIMIARPKTISREYRFFIVDGEVVTGSLYKRGGRVLYSSEIDEDVLAYAQARVDEWRPARGFVIDVALLPDGEMKIIETNTLNAAGMYHSNVGKLVGAIEAMTF